MACFKNQKRSPIYLVMLVVLAFTNNTIMSQDLVYEVDYEVQTIRFNSPAYDYGNMPMHLRSRLENVKYKDDFDKVNLFSLVQYQNQSKYSFLKQYETNGTDIKKGSETTKTLFPKVPIYKDFNSGIAYVETLDSLNSWHPPSPFITNWEIDRSEPREILGMTCYRASRTSEVGILKNIPEVWFTEEIPISNGPYFMDGLPGLIVYAVNANKIYRAIKIEVYSHNGEKLELSPIDKKPEIDYEEYRERNKEILMGGILN